MSWEMLDNSNNKIKISDMYFIDWIKTNDINDCYE